MDVRAPTCRLPAAPNAATQADMPAHRRVVEDVIVNQGRSVDHFNDRAQGVVRGRHPAASVGRQQEEGGPEPFAATRRARLPT